MAQQERNSNMTKKEFIWLGIRAIGIYWLLRLIFAIAAPVYIITYMLLSNTNAASYAMMTWVCFLSNIPAPIILTIYFLFFGKLIYKLINHFTQPAPTDCLQTTQYPEIAVRFLGLWLVSGIIGKFYISFTTCLQSALMVYLMPEHAPGYTFATHLRQQFFNIEMIVSLSIWLLLSSFLVWYFLKKGNLFINLLNSLWLGKFKEENQG